jgi:hypothetical protein
MIWSRWLFFLFVMYGVAATAAPERMMTMDDFAYGYALDTPGVASVYAAPLPVDAYHFLRRQDLGDLRVFNAQGEAVPHALMRPAASTDAPKRVRLPVFPIRDSDDATSGKMAVRVNRDAQGTIIDIRDDLPSVKDKPVVAYVLDASKLDRALTKFIVQWPATEGFVANVYVSASENLNYWWTVSTSATLAELAHGSERLTRNTIEIKPTKAKYFRIGWSKNSSGISIVGIEAELASQAQVLVPMWLTLEGIAEKDKEGSERYVFDTGGRFPVERVNLLLADANSLVRATIYSRADEKTEWRQRYHGLFYRLNRNDAATEFRNDPVLVGRALDRLWRIDLAVENGATSGAVKLEIGWVPDRVTFLARGSGPYVLAYGSIQARGAEQPVAELLRALDRHDNKVTPQAANIRERMVLGGEDRLQARPAPLPWRRILLWAVLVGGVALLAAMTLGLARQMKQTK